MSLSQQAHSKVTASHLKRDAYLYIRQSTLRQVLENKESTQRQYGLRERALAMGWPIERVVIIDCDLGQSGATADRVGFQRLVTEVGMGRAGIVLGLEVSRLARNCVDWHRLLEICALTQTLIMDEEGVYDPGHFNDRLLLGLKGTMSEAELHFLKARMRGGLLNKARRGELKKSIPIGYNYDARDRVVLDPDQQVQQAVRLLFQTFRRTGSAFKTVKAFREQELLFPRRPTPFSEQVLWGPLGHSRVLQIIHNPWYAGAYCFGRTRTRPTIEGGSRTHFLPREEWLVLIRDAHHGYISWEDYEENVHRLQENSQAHGTDRRRSPAREGPALLQGLVICGVCGRRMTVRYHVRGGKRSPDYACQNWKIERGEAVCQTVPGGTLDGAIGSLLMQTVTPMALEVALQVQQELETRASEIDQLRRQQVERARYEAELSRRRYMRVDPDNRLVAETLEADWNEKLRQLTAAQEEYERYLHNERKLLTGDQRAEIQALAADFPRLWSDPRTPDQERKRIVRLMLEDVTLLKGEKVVTAHIRFRGGATQSLVAPFLPNFGEQIKTDPRVLEELDRILEDHDYDQAASTLNSKGFRLGTGGLFSGPAVYRIRWTYGLKSRTDRLREQGMLTVDEIASLLGVIPATAQLWRRHGLLVAHRAEKNTYLFEPPGDNPPRRFARKGLGL